MLLLYSPYSESVTLHIHITSLQWYLPFAPLCGPSAPQCNLNEEHAEMRPIVWHTSSASRGSTVPECITFYGAAVLTGLLQSHHRGLLDQVSLYEAPEILAVHAEIW